MKAKYIKVLDEMTDMLFLVIQFECSDEHILIKYGKTWRTKIILNISDDPITCISGYDLNDRFGNTVQSLSKQMVPNGTTNALKEIIHLVDDIHKLPDVINVNEARRAFNHTTLSEFKDNDLYDIVENMIYDESYRKSLSKLIFKEKNRELINILIVEKATKRIE